ncbi:MAG: MoxR family ATPase [Thermomicrobiales bacterium]
MPSDITGVTFFDQKHGDFQFRPGPVFANVVVADEINRATPRTQSALLEAMEERTVTVEGETSFAPQTVSGDRHREPLTEPEGTFPLPEAQIDRFMMRLEIGYPTEEEEREIISRSGRGTQQIEAVTSPARMQEMIESTKRIHISDDVRRYVARLICSTRTHPVVRLGPVRRATIALSRASQAFAAIAGRCEALPDDAKALAPHVLTHRIVLSPEAMLRGRTAASVVAEILEQEPVPDEGAAGLARSSDERARRPVRPPPHGRPVRSRGLFFTRLWRYAAVALLLGLVTQPWLSPLPVA